MDDFLVTYKDEVYNLKKFIEKHPGGSKVFAGLQNKSIDAKFDLIKHSPGAKLLMKEYKVQKDCDDDLEDLVDWSLPMIPQIPKLGSNYNKWINHPVDRPLILYENPFFELLTKVPWHLPLFAFVPVILNIFYNARQVNLLMFLLHVITGIFIWTFIEYIQHRFLFHMKAENRGALTTFHFVIHGMHHKVPFDKYRQTINPLGAGIIAFIFYQPIYLLEQYLPHTKLIYAGILCGYLCYEMCHYYSHNATNISFMKENKRYHLNHHFQHHHGKFGIFTRMWDDIFKTVSQFIKQLNS